MPLDAISEPELDPNGPSLPTISAGTMTCLIWSPLVADFCLIPGRLAGHKQSHGTFENLSLTDCGIASSKRRESHSCSLGVWCEARNCNPIRCSLAQQTVDSSVN